MSTDTRPICWPIRRPRVIVRMSADMSIDRLPTFRRYFTATCPGCVTWNKVHRGGGGVATTPFSPLLDTALFTPVTDSKFFCLRRT